MRFEFEPILGWLIFSLIWAAPPPLFSLKSSFGWGGIKIFTSDQNPLLAWGYPEILSQIWYGWIFASFGGAPHPFLSLKSSFGWGGKFFKPQCWSLIGTGLPWKFEVNRTYGWGCGYFSWCGAVLVLVPGVMIQKTSAYLLWAELSWAVLVWAGLGLAWSLVWGLST